MFYLSNIFAGVRDLAEALPLKKLTRRVKVPAVKRKQNKGEF